MYIPALRHAFNRLLGRDTTALSEAVNAAEGDAEGAGAGADSAAPSAANNSFIRPEWHGIGMYPLIDGYPFGQMVSVMDGVETVPAAALCVAIYADTVADLPKFVRRVGSRNKRLEDHWLTHLLNDPHGGINGPKLWRWVGREVAARGEACLAIERRGGIPVELRPARLRAGQGIGNRVDMQGMRVWVDIPDAMFDGVSVGQEYASEDILHFTDVDYDPVLGIAPNPLNNRAKNPIGAYKQIWNRWSVRQAAGGHDNIYVTLPEHPDEWEAFTERWMRQAAGWRNAGKPFPLPYGSTTEALKLTDVERETLGMLNFLVIDIARAWGIPPFMIYARLGEGVSARARSDLAEQFLNWQRLRYASFVKIVAAEIDKKILQPLARIGMRSAQGVCVEFDLDHMTMGTFEGRAKIAVQLHAGGILTKNEARGLVDFDRIEGGDELPQVRGAPGSSGDSGGGSGGGGEGTGDGKGSSAGGDEPNEPAEEDDPDEM